MVGPPRERCADAAAAAPPPAGIWCSGRLSRRRPGVVPAMACLLYTSSTAEVLPAIVDAVGGRMTILVDGGIRTGVDVCKACLLYTSRCV